VYSRFISNISVEVQYKCDFLYICLRTHTVFVGVVVCRKKNVIIKRVLLEGRYVKRQKIRIIFGVFVVVVCYVAYQSFVYFANESIQTGLQRAAEKKKKRE